MLSAPSFFDLSSFEHRRLFDDCTYVWDALLNLKPYMNGLSYGDFWHNNLIQDGAPLVKTVILHENSMFEAKDTTIEYGDATKGNLRVYKDGQHLEGAGPGRSGIPG